MKTTKNETTKQNKRTTFVKVSHQVRLLEHLVLSLTNTVEGTNTYENEVQAVVEAVENLACSLDGSEGLFEPLTTLEQVDNEQVVVVSHPCSDEDLEPFVLSFKTPKTSMGAGGWVPGRWTCFFWDEWETVPYVATLDDGNANANTTEQVSNELARQVAQNVEHTFYNV